MTTLTTVVPASVMSMPLTGTAVFTWDSSEPIAMTMTVDLPFAETITFHFSRELLDQALMYPGRSAGIGDIIIEDIEPAAMALSGARREPTTGTSQLRFLMAHDNGTRVAILVPQPPVADMVVRSYMVVPAEAEKANVDYAIRHILGQAS